MSEKANVAVFISGGGTNLQSLINASHEGKLSATIVLVVSRRENVYGLERAHRAGIDTFVYNPKRYPDKQAAHKDLIEMMESYAVDYIALAGYLNLLPESLVRKYRNRITNIHPALLPKHGGKGMFGHHVHEAVIAAGDTESGATVHLVDEIYDNGRILLQKKVPVLPDDTPDSLAARVLEVEHEIYPIALENLIQGK
ncbi:MAG: phosphoribosylglycinamide formyltransferase [candidate division Zixibacteria bacterium]|nr:phosphoribosylglycinamide formyltransferase [candidate division Zixibacteria bacterium]